LFVLLELHKNEFPCSQFGEAVLFGKISGGNGVPLRPTGQVAPMTKDRFFKDIATGLNEWQVVAEA
jgi:hypothetical protein